MLPDRHLSVPIRVVAGVLLPVFPVSFFVLPPKVSEFFRRRPAANDAPASLPPAAA